MCCIVLKCYYLCYVKGTEGKGKGKKWVPESTRAKTKSSKLLKSIAMNK